MGGWREVITPGQEVMGLGREVMPSGWKGLTFGPSGHDFLTIVDVVLGGGDAVLAAGDADLARGKGNLPGLMGGSGGSYQLSACILTGVWVFILHNHNEKRGLTHKHGTTRFHHTRVADCWQVVR